MRFRALAVLTTLFCSAWSARADILWERNYEVASAKARATGKPLFIDFYTDWCGWCKKLDAEVYPDARVQSLAQGFVMLKLDAEREGASAARAFGVKSYPSLFFVRVEQRKIVAVAGFRPADRFADTMQQVLQSAPRRRAVTARRTTPAIRTNSPRRTPAIIRVKNWRQAPELRGATSNSHYQGAYLLGENGIIALDTPAKATKSRAKPRKRHVNQPVIDPNLEAVREIR